MAESWVRLWAGMTTDPKWQTVARKSGQPRALVIALFTHLMLEANEADDRGSVVGVDIEDVASALDCDEQAVADILHAMDGRVILEGRLSGWDRRQPKREDSGDERTGALSSTERSRLFREKKRHATQGNGCNDSATQGNAPEAEAEADTEKGVPQAASTHSIEGARTDDDAAASSPDPINLRAIELTALLRQRGAALQASNPTVRSWAERGITDAQALAALDIANERRAAQASPQPVNAGYLDTILRDVTAPPQARASPTTSKTARINASNQAAFAEAKAAILAREAPNEDQ